MHFHHIVSNEIVVSVARNLINLKSDSELSLASRVEDYFSAEMGCPAVAGGTHVVPRFLALAESQSNGIGGVFDLSKLIETAPFQHLSGAPTVANNLREVGLLFRLTSIEQKVIRWTYGRTRSVAPPVSLLLADIRVTSAQRQDEILAMLLDETVDAVHDCFEHYRLIGMGLLIPFKTRGCGFHRRSMPLSNIFPCDDKLAIFLESLDLTPADFFTFATARRRL